MTRAEIERKIEPIIEECRRRFAPGSTDTSESPPTSESLRPEIRRVSLIASLADSALEHGGRGEALEIGSGYGYLLLPMASLFPHIRWFAVDHRDRPYVNRQTYKATLSSHNCELAVADVARESLPFPNDKFSLVTFSEVLEHLPPHCLNFVVSEIARIIRPGGVLIASSPNQASLENRLRLLTGTSILDMPDEVPCGSGIFGHIRLYTPSEMQGAMGRLGFRLERLVIESNNSEYRGPSAGSWRRLIYRIYERVEASLTILRPLGDTWYMVFRKDSGLPSA